MRHRSLLVLVLWAGALSSACSRSAGGPNDQTSLLWQPAQRLTNGPGDSFTTYNFLHVIAADGAGRVHGIYYGNGEGIDHVYYLRSVDGGATWEPPARLSDGPVGGEHPSVAVSGDFVYAAWHDDCCNDPSPRVVLRRSTDGGASWDRETVLAEEPEGSAHASVFADGDRVYVVFGDHRDGPSTEVYLRASYDRGATWEPGRPISETPYESWVPTVAADGELVLVGWVDYRDANEEEYLRRSTDGGRTFGPIVRMTDDAHDSWAPSIAIEGDTVYFFWFDRRDAGITDTEVETRLDDVLLFMGETPDPAPGRDPSAYYLHDFLDRIAAKLDLVGQQIGPFGAAGGDVARVDELLAEFYAGLQQWDTGWELYYRRSDDRGSSFGADTRLTFAAGMSMRPSVGTRGDEVHVAWFDGRHDGDLEIYYRRSLDRGESWEDEVRITDSVGTSRRVGLAVAESGVHLLWYDERHGPAEIYYRRALFE